MFALAFFGIGKLIASTFAGSKDRRKHSKFLNWCQVISAVAGFSGLITYANTEHFVFWHASIATFFWGI